MFATLSDRLSATFKNLRGKGRLSEADIDATARDIRVALLEADVALPVVKDFIAAVRERSHGEDVSQALNPAQQVVKIVNDELVRILGGEARRLRFAKQPPSVILLAGLQGVGKTTLAGKLARHLKEQGKQPMLVAADLQRPNAVTQLQVVGENAGVAVFAPEPGNGVGNPVEVARKSIAHARDKLYDVVIVDTAGRLGVDEDMMRQAADIRDAVSPDETLFVVDAMVGQDAVNTALAFEEGVGFDGVVLAKLDGDARGGAALSVASVTGKPIMFASSGEKLTDFDVFHPERMASRILDLGDMLTLIEQAEQAFDAKQAEEMTRKLTDKGGKDFTFDDFLAQMQAVKKMGSMKSLLGMLPGAGQIREQLENFDERELDRVTAIVYSMTPAERNNPKVINGSRRSRIARGSGTQVSDVNQLVERFYMARDMMSQAASGKLGGLGGLMGGGGPGGLPGVGPGGGMPGMPGMGKKSKGKQPKQKKGKKGRAGRSGNPAKRAAEAAAEEHRAKSPEPGEIPSAFGGGNGAGGSGDDFELPDDIKDFFDKR